MGMGSIKNKNQAMLCQIHNSEQDKTRNRK